MKAVQAMKAVQEYYVNILNFLEMVAKVYKVSFTLVTIKYSSTYMSRTFFYPIQKTEIFRKKDGKWPQKKKGAKKADANYTTKQLQNLEKTVATKNPPKK